MKNGDPNPVPRGGHKMEAHHRLAFAAGCEYLAGPHPVLSQQSRRVLPMGMFARVCKLAVPHPRWRTLRLPRWFRSEDWPVSHKRVERLLRLKRS